MTIRRAAMAFAMIILPNLACQSSSPVDDDEKIDIEAIKRETRAALPEKDRDKVDLSYITRELVKRAKKEAQPAKRGHRDKEGKRRESPDTLRNTDFGNNPFREGGIIRYQNGDVGPQYCCGRSHWNSGKYINSIPKNMICPGCFEIIYDTID